VAGTARATTWVRALEQLVDSLTPPTATPPAAAAGGGGRHEAAQDTQSVAQPPAAPSLTRLETNPKQLEKQWAKRWMDIADPEMREGLLHRRQAADKLWWAMLRYYTHLTSSSSSSVIAASRQKAHEAACAYQAMEGPTEEVGDTVSGCSQATAAVPRVNMVTVTTGEPEEPPPTREPEVPPPEPNALDLARDWASYWKMVAGGSLSQFTLLAPTELIQEYRSCWDMLCRFENSLWGITMGNDSWQELQEPARYAQERICQLLKRLEEPASAVSSEGESSQELSATVAPRINMVRGVDPPSRSLPREAIEQHGANNIAAPSHVAPNRLLMLPLTTFSTNPQATQVGQLPVPSGPMPSQPSVPQPQPQPETQASPHGLDLDMERRWVHHWRQLAGENIYRLTLAAPGEIIEGYRESCELLLVYEKRLWSEDNEREPWQMLCRTARTAQARILFFIQQTLEEKAGVHYPVSPAAESDMQWQGRSHFYILQRSGDQWPCQHVQLNKIFRPAMAEELLAQYRVTPNPALTNLREGALVVPPYPMSALVRPIIPLDGTGGQQLAPLPASDPVVQCMEDWSPPILPWAEPTQQRMATEPAAEAPALRKRSRAPSPSAGRREGPGPQEPPRVAMVKVNPFRMDSENEDSDRDAAPTPATRPPRRNRQPPTRERMEEEEEEEEEEEQGAPGKQPQGTKGQAPALAEEEKEKRHSPAEAQQRLRPLGLLAAAAAAAAAANPTALPPPEQEIEEVPTSDSKDDFDSGGTASSEEDKGDYYESRPCTVCDKNNNQAQMVMCERYRRFTHLYCRDVFLNKRALPKGPWYCDMCCPAEGPLPSELAAMGEDGGQLEDYVKWGDIWTDKETLDVLMGNGAETTPRARKRAKLYIYEDGTIKTAKTGRKVPKPEERLPLLRQLHETTGHRGARSLADVARHQWYWVNLRGDAEKVVGECTHCDPTATFKGIRTPPLKSIPASSLFRHWTMDLIGPMAPARGSGHRYILTAIESFSRDVIAVGLPDKRSDSVAQAFYKEVVLARMCPESVHVDRGGEWYAAFSQLCKKLGIKIVHGAAHSPWVQGLVERANQQLERSLGAYQRQHGVDQWERFLPNAVFALRVAKQRSTGHSPFKIMYGVEARLPEGLEPAAGPILPITAEEDELKQRQAGMQRTYKRALDNDVKAKGKQAEAFNKRTRTATSLPDPGTLVRLAMPLAGSGAKKEAKAKLTVPVEVVEYPNESTVIVRDGTGQTWGEPVSALRVAEKGQASESRRGTRGVLKKPRRGPGPGIRDDDQHPDDN
jgi:transposase InsO family protein